MRGGGARLEQELVLGLFRRRGRSGARLLDHCDGAARRGVVDVSELMSRTGGFDGG